MNPKAVERVFEDIDPPSNLVSEDKCDTLLIHLNGFKRDELKVQLTKSGILRVSGEHPLGDNKWRRFRKEFHIPSNCNTDKITAKFEHNILSIRQPKLTSPVPSPSPPPSPPPKNEAKQTEQAPKVQPQQVSPTPQPRPPESQHEESPTREEVIPPKGSDRGKIGEVSESRYRQTMVERVNGMVGCGSGLVREFMKPENVKMLAVSVVGVLIIGFYVVYMFKSLTGDEELSYLDNLQEL